MTSSKALPLALTVAAVAGSACLLHLQTRRKRKSENYKECEGSATPEATAEDEQKQSEELEILNVKIEAMSSEIRDLRAELSVERSAQREHNEVVSRLKEEVGVLQSSKHCLEECRQRNLAASPQSGILFDHDIAVSGADSASDDWRKSVPESFRSEEVRNIAEVLASLEPGATSASKLMLAMRFEDAVFQSASSLSDYRKAASESDYNESSGPKVVRFRECGSYDIHGKRTSTTRESPIDEPIENHKDSAAHISTDGETCTCSSSLFSGNDAQCELLLPKLGMACTCGKAKVATETTTALGDKVGLSHILRPWQVQFLESVGIITAEQLVRVKKKEAGKIVRQMKSWRKVNHLVKAKTKHCYAALYIWARTAKVVLKSVEKQAKMNGSVVATLSPMAGAA